MLEQSSFLSAMDETWRPVAGDAGWYEVSDQGRVRSLRARRGMGSRPRLTPLILSARPDRKGYLWVRLSNKAEVKIHRLVLEAFVGPCPRDYEGSHLNGRRDDNRLVNLAWETHAQNMRRAVRAAPREPRPRHEYVRERRLTTEQVVEIRTAHAGGVGKRVLARRYGVGKTTVQHVLKRSTWKYVPA